MTPKLIPYEDDGEVKFLVHVLKHRPCYSNSLLGESDKIEQKSAVRSNGRNVDKNTAVGVSWLFIISNFDNDKGRSKECGSYEFCVKNNIISSML